MPFGVNLMRSTSLSRATIHRSVTSHLLLVLCLSLSSSLFVSLCLPSAFDAASCFMQRLVKLGSLHAKQGERVNTL